MVTYTPSGTIGFPDHSTDDVQPSSSFALRAKATSADVIVSGLRWPASSAGLPTPTAGTKAKAFAYGLNTLEKYAESPETTSTVDGWNDLIFDEPFTLTSGEEVYFIVQQDGSAKYMYTSGAYTDGYADSLITCLGPAGNWDYELAPGAFEEWTTSNGQHSVNSYGVDLIIGVATDLAVAASHDPSTSVVNEEITLSAAVTDADGTPVYAWSQTAGTTVSISNGTTDEATFTPTVPGTYTFRVDVTDDSGSAFDTTSIVITGEPDTEAPSVPENLVSSSVSKTVFTVTCDAATDNNAVTTYRWYVGGVLYGTSVSPVKAFSSRTPDTDYSVTVAAGDAAGNWSAQSDALVVHTLADSSSATAMGELFAKLDDGTVVSFISAKPEPEWVFRPEAYGAKGDGVYLGDVHTTNASPNVSSASAAFTQDDVGKTIMITMKNGASNGAQIPLITTIVTVTDANNVILAGTAPRTQTDGSAFYSTDDSAAFLELGLAIRDYHLTAQNPHVKVILDRKYYGLATLPTADTDGSIGTWSRAQFPLPVNPSQTGRKWVTEIVGTDDLDNATFTSWHQTEPQMSGCMLVSMVNVGSGQYIANWPVSVIGGPSNDPSDWEGAENVFNNTLVTIDGVRVMSPFNPGQIAIDLVLEGQYDIGKVGADIFSAPHGLTGSYMISTNADGMGFRTNYTGFNDRSTIEALYIQGYYTGAYLDEHCCWDNITVIYSHFGIYLSLPTGGSYQHGATIDYASIEICDYPLYVGVGSSSDENPVAFFGLNISMLDTEGESIEHIHDPGNVLHGQVIVFPTGSQSSGPNDIIANGGAGLSLINAGGGEVVAP